MQNQFNKTKSNQHIQINLAMQINLTKQNQFNTFKSI